MNEFDFGSSPFVGLESFENPEQSRRYDIESVSYTHLRAHET